MKRFLPILLLICAAMHSQAQLQPVKTIDTTTLTNGKTIVVYSDKTWKYIEQTGKPTTDDWQIYKHPNGYQIDLPTDCKISALSTPAFQYFKHPLLDHDMDIKMIIQTFQEGSERSLNELYDLYLHGVPNATANLEATTFTIMGARKNVPLEYYQAFISNGKTFLLTLYYPLKLKNQVNKWIAHFATSFKASI